MVSKRRKLSSSVIAAAALCVLAFATLPALASAAKLESPAGTLMKAGTRITLKSTNVRWEMPALGKTTTCEIWEWYGIVQKDANGVVEVGPYGEPSGAASNCKMGTETLTIHPRLKSMVLSAASNTLSWDFETSGGLFEGSVSTVEYLTGANHIHVEGHIEGTVPGIFRGDFTAVNPFTGKQVIFT